MIFNISINLVTAAIAVAVLGTAALGIYICREILRDCDESFDPRWMDRDKWERSQRR